MNRIRKILKKAVSEFTGHKKTSIPRYQNFDDALKACFNNGYTNIELVEHVVKKNVFFRNELSTKKIISNEAIRALPALVASAKFEKLSVLDFGGGGGAHFSTIKSMLNCETRILWCIVETKEMVHLAREFGLENESLKFFKSIEEAQASVASFDLVFSSSALQYCENPLNTLKSLINIGAKNFYITRTPLIVSNSDVITIQKSHLGDNGPGQNPEGFIDKEILYPITYISKDKLLDVLLEKYTVCFEMEQSAGILQIEGESIEMPSIYASLKDK